MREALASTNREKGILLDRQEALEKQLSRETEANATLASLNRELEEEVRKAREELNAVTRKYEGTRITREELISELLEKEKATGKRIQELSAMAQACEIERERLLEETAAREAVLGDLEAKLAESPDMESLRRERDILLGRIERIKEERAEEARRRDARFAELVKAVSGLSSSIAASPAGPAVRILVPDRILYRKGKATLTNAGRKVIGEVGRTASEFPAAMIIIATKGKPQTDEILDALVKGHALPPGRVFAQAGNRNRETELLLVIP